MKRRFVPLMFMLGVTAAAAMGQQEEVSLPTSQPSVALVPHDKPALGKLFRSRFDGIELNPPAGGTLIRQLNSGDIVRFSYPDHNWDIRVKPIPLHVEKKLQDILELTATNLTDSNPTAQILRQELTRVNGKTVGMIEARYNAGTDRIFAQQAIFRDNDKHYFVIQMNSPGQLKNAPANAVDPQENQARNILLTTLNTVQILKRSDVYDEQVQRFQNTRLLWVQIDQKQILHAIQPLHFMRIVRDGKDVGFVQMNERTATHFGRTGIEIIVHSRVETETDQPVAGIKQPAPEATGIVVSSPLIPAKGKAVMASKSADQYSSSIYFVTFDRAHEDWSTITQTGDQVATQITEMANSDLADHLAIDQTEAANDLRNARGPKDKKQPIMTVPDYSLNVSRYSASGKPIGNAYETKLKEFYLPQALGQILPRVLPNNASKYLFASYVSSQHDVLYRYVDVDEPRQVELDGQTVRAIPVTDRIGVDGIPTVNYVTRSGQWLGSVNEESKLEVLPTDETVLKSIWPNFAVSPEPPQQSDAPVVKPVPRVQRPIVNDPAEVQPMGNNGR